MEMKWYGLILHSLVLTPHKHIAGGYMNYPALAFIPFIIYSFQKQAFDEGGIRDLK